MASINCTANNPLVGISRLPLTEVLPHQRKITSCLALLSFANNIRPIHQQVRNIEYKLKALINLPFQIVVIYFEGHTDIRNTFLDLLASVFEFTRSIIAVARIAH